MVVLVLGLDVRVEGRKVLLWGSARAVSGGDEPSVELHAQAFSSWFGALKAPVRRPQYSLPWGDRMAWRVS